LTAAKGKLFNSVLNYRLDAFLRNNELIRESQIGFTKKARTTYHLFVLKCILDEYCSESSILFVILSRPGDLLFFNFEMAFEISS
jgi:hypothetical protein